MGRNIDDYNKAKELGFTNLNRWEDGVDHHPMSERLVQFMSTHDLHDYDLSMDIEIGGDGDNGESMMYLMDAFFEMLDETKTKVEKTKIEVNKSILNYFKMVMDFDNESVEYREVTEKEFVDKLTKSLNNGDENTKIKWVD